MSHHSQDVDPMMQKFIEFANAGMKASEALEKLGATGKFPNGKLTLHDEGEIRFTVAIVKGKIIIEFGKPVHWLGMTGEQAIDLGRLLIKRGRKLLKREADAVHQKSTGMAEASGQ